jgi:hypothetical protein
MASHDKILTGDLRILGNVMESGTAQVVLHNPTGAAITVPSGTVGVLVFPSLESNVTEPTFTVTWTVEESEAGVSGESWSYYFTPVVTGGTAPYTYAWNFGDGNPDDPSENPTQVWDRGAYSNPDTISVTLTVTDDLSDTAVFTDDVVVQFNE